MTMSIADLLDDWFESPQVKGALAVNGVIGTWAGPFEPGTAYVMAHHSIGDVGDGQLGSWGYPEGGMGAVSAAIRRSAESFGAEVRTDAAVSSLLVKDGRVEGAVLASGEELRAPVVVTSLHPRRAFLEHVGAAHLPDDFVRDIERWRSRSGVVKINLAIDRLPSFTADPTDGQAEHHTGSVEMAPTMEFIERAFLDAREGRAGRRAVRATGSSRPPWTARSTPTARTSSRCSPSGCPRTGTSSRTPTSSRPTPTGSSTSTTRWRRASATRSSPATSSGPHQMETEYGLIGGNIFHGELSLEQLFHLRPAPGYADYRTPIARALQRQLGHPRGRRRLRHPGHAGSQSRPAGRTGRAPLPATAAQRAWRR